VKIIKKAAFFIPLKKLNGNISKINKEVIY